MRVIGFATRRPEPDRHHCVVWKQVRGGRRIGHTAGARGGAVLSRKGVPVVQTAHAMRASLLASATAALLWPRRRSSWSAQCCRRCGAGGLLGVTEHGASAVDQEHAEIGVPALADGPQPAAQAARMLTGRQAEVAGEVAPRGEAMRMADEADQRGRGEETDAGDGAQSGDERRRDGERLELLLHGPYTALELADLRHYGGRPWAQARGDGAVLGREECGDTGHDLARSDRNRD